MKIVLFYRLKCVALSSGQDSIRILLQLLALVGSAETLRRRKRTALKAQCLPDSRTQKETRLL